jgi:hypothetical protein
MKAIASLKLIEQQAHVLAKENKKSEPGIKKILWFPDSKEVRLVMLEDDLPRSISKTVEPFYFSPSRVDKLPARSGIALIRTDEKGKLKLPEGWGNWGKAKELVSAK